MSARYFLQNTAQRQERKTIAKPEIQVGLPATADLSFDSE
jgi:hypothetical protein